LNHFTVPVAIVRVSFLVSARRMQRTGSSVLID